MTKYGTRWWTLSFYFDMNFFFLLTWSIIFFLVHLILLCHYFSSPIDRMQFILIDFGGKKCCNVRLKHEHMTIQMILERKPQNPRPSKLCTAQSWRLFAVARNFISVTQRSTILELNFTDQSISVLSPQTLWTHSRWPTLVFFSSSFALIWKTHTNTIWSPFKYRLIDFPRWNKYNIVETYALLIEIQHLHYSRTSSLAFALAPNASINTHLIDYKS